MNENPPAFSSAATATVSEDVVIGTSVHTATATAVGEVLFSIESITYGKFDMYVSYILDERYTVDIQYIHTFFPVHMFNKWILFI